MVHVVAEITYSSHLETRQENKKKSRSLSYYFKQTLDKLKWKKYFDEKSKILV